MNDRTTNRNQWIAILILGAMVLCALGVIFTGPIQSPVSTRPLWNVPTTATVRDGPAVNSNPVCYFGDSTAVNGQIQSFNGENKVCVVDSYGNASWSPLEEYLTTTYGTPVPTEVAYTPITPATATTTPIPNDVVECYFAGARMTDGHITSVERIGGAGRCQIDAITGEMSLQPYWEQVVNYDTALPIGLEVNDVQKETFEPGNDFVWVVAVKRNGIMSYFVADSIESITTFPFWWTSCVSYNYEANIMTFYKDDDGKAGSFEGNCAGIHKEFDGKPASSFSGEVLTYINAIEKLEAAGYTVPNQPFIFDEVWLETWPK